MEQFIMTILAHSDLKEEDFDRTFSCLGGQVFDHICTSTHSVPLSAKCDISICLGCTCFESQGGEISTEEIEHWKAIHKKDICSNLLRE